MRLLTDTIVALMLLALLAGFTWQRRTDQALQQDRQTTRAEVRRFQQQIALQAALARVQRDERGYPSTVDPQWFMGSLPANPLLDDAHPWLEIAGPEEKNLRHPQQRVATSTLVAKFWYNPDTGVVRARVAPAVSDAAALENYNFINDSDLPELFAD